LDVKVIVVDFERVVELGDIWSEEKAKNANSSLEVI
jgi:hypothetical protein